MVVDQDLTVAAVLSSGVLALWLAYNRSLSEAKKDTNERIDVIEKALNSCQAKHDAANQELGNLKREIGELTGKLAVYDKFNPSDLVDRITKKVQKIVNEKGANDVPEGPV